MIGAKVTYTSNTARIEKAVDKAAYRNIGRALGSISKDAKGSMIKAFGPSRPGTPPNVHRGRLQRAIRYAYDAKAQAGVVGPQYIANARGGKGYGYPPLVGRIHEFGGMVGPQGDKRAPEVKYKKDSLGRWQDKETGRFVSAKRVLAEQKKWKSGRWKKARNFPARPFMRPALERAQARLADSWRSSITG